MLKLGQHYDLLCNMIIRPPRFVYEMVDLGPRYFSAGGKPAQRTDFELRNSRGLIIQCSHFEPLTNWDHPVPCVIYLHGNGGCRIEALDVVHTLLPSDISVLALDFAGSGLSEGEYVSLGYWEQYDVQAVVQYLREANRCSTIGLWGRSMGAVTAILYSMQDPSIASMILDSPFCSLQKIAEDLVMNVETLQKVPRFTKFAVGLAMRPIRSTIKKKAKFDIRSLEILDLVSKCYIPALFIHGRDDNFVLPVHSEMLYANYSGDKNRILVEGNHNSIRPNFVMDSAVIFFNNTLHNGADHTMPKGASSTHLPQLPLSIPQHQAAIQLQQFNDVMHPFQSPAHAQAQVQQAQPEAHAPPQTQAQVRPGVALEQIDVSNFTNNPAQNHTKSNGLHGSVVIDDMVIGNRVIIDGKEVILDAEDDGDEPFYTSQMPLSQPTLSSSPTFVSPPYTQQQQQPIPLYNEQNGQITNNYTELQHTNPPPVILLPPTSSTSSTSSSNGIETTLLTPIHDPPPPPHPQIVYDNANFVQEEDIPEEIEEENNNNVFTFRAESEIPGDHLN